MKNNELFIGALLNIYNFPNDNPKEDDLFPAMVSSVSVFDPFKAPDDVHLELVIPKTKGIASRPMDTCLPIPVDAGWLKKFGFTEVEGTSSYELCTDYYDLEVWEYTDSIWVVKFHNCEACFTDEVVLVTHIHELQYQLNRWQVAYEIDL